MDVVAIIVFFLTLAGKNYITCMMENEIIKRVILLHMFVFASYITAGSF